MKILKMVKADDKVKAYRLCFVPFFPHPWFDFIPENECMLSMPLFYHTNTKKLCKRTTKAIYLGKETTCKTCKSRGGLVYVALAVNVLDYFKRVKEAHDSGQEPDPSVAEPMWVLRSENDLSRNLVHLFALGYYLRMQEKLVSHWSLSVRLEPDGFVSMLPEMRSITFTPAQKQMIDSVSAEDIDPQKLIK